MNGLTVAVGHATVLPDTATLAQPPVRVEVFVEDGARLAKLARLADDWDGEGAPAPSHAAIQRANGVLRWALESGLVATDVEADVLGGVGVVLRAYPRTMSGSAWIACMNNGKDTIVLSRRTDVCGHASWDAGDAAKVRVRDFLASDRSGVAHT